MLASHQPQPPPDTSAFEQDPVCPRGAALSQEPSRSSASATFSGSGRDPAPLRRRARARPLRRGPASAARPVSGPPPAGWRGEVIPSDPRPALPRPSEYNPVHGGHLPPLFPAMDERLDRAACTRSSAFSSAACAGPPPPATRCWWQAQRITTRATDGPSPASRWVEGLAPGQHQGGLWEGPPAHRDRVNRARRHLRCSRLTAASPLSFRPGGPASPGDFLLVQRATRGSGSTPTPIEQVRRDQPGLPRRSSSSTSPTNRPPRGLTGAGRLRRRLPPPDGQAPPTRPCARARRGRRPAWPLTPAGSGLAHGGAATRAAASRGLNHVAGVEHGRGGVRGLGGCASDHGRRGDAPGAGGGGGSRAHLRLGDRPGPPAPSACSPRIVVLRNARHAGSGMQGFSVGMCLVAVAMAWFHPSHSYPCATRTSTTATTRRGSGASSFPCEAAPSYFDFAYFSFTVGMCFQVRTWWCRARRSAGRCWARRSWPSSSTPPSVALALILVFQSAQRARPRGNRAAVGGGEGMSTLEQV
jgi:hypothetical protein